MAVQEDKKSKDGSDGDEEEGDTKEDLEEMSDDDYDGFAFPADHPLCWPNKAGCSMLDREYLSNQNLR